MYNFYICSIISSVVYACFWLYINFGPKLAYIEQLLRCKSLSRSTIFGWAFRWEILHSLEWSYSHDFKPIYLHYLYLFRGKTIGKSGCSSRCICSSTLTLFLKPIYHFIGVEQFTCFWVEQFTRLCIVWSGAIHMILSQSICIICTYFEAKQ